MCVFVCEYYMSCDVVWFFMPLTGDAVQRTSPPDAGSASEPERPSGALPLPEEGRPALGPVAVHAGPGAEEARGGH